MVESIVGYVVLALFLFFMFGGLGVIEVWVDGHRAIARLKGENKALRQQLEQSGTAPAVGTIDPRIVHLLYRIQAVDSVLPQLPNDTRAELDAILVQPTGLLPPAKRKGPKK